MNETQLSVINALTVSFLCGIIIYFERAFPFLLFSKREPPKFLQFIEKYIPQMVIAALLTYCLKDTQFNQVKDWIPPSTALAVTMILHLWRGNFLISIFSGTAIYMLLIRIL